MKLHDLVERVRADEIFKFVELELGVLSAHDATSASFGLLYAKAIKMASLRGRMMRIFL